MLGEKRRGRVDGILGENEGSGKRMKGRDGSRGKVDEGGVEEE